MFISPPKKIPFYLKIAIFIAERTLGKTVMPARILAWYPKAAIGAGVMESLVAHKAGRVTERMLKLVRMQVSFSASCPFCIDLNSAGFEKDSVNAEEIEALQGLREADTVTSLNEREKCALQYARVLTASPLRIPAALQEKLRRLFTEREIVVLAGTIAQVNFWTRLIQGIGVKPAGFSDSCPLLRLDDYVTVDTAEASQPMTGEEDHE